MEQPVARWDFSSCHFSPTLASMLGATLIRYPVVAGCEPGEPGLWASLRRVQALHRAPLPLAGILRWIPAGAWLPAAAGLRARQTRRACFA